MDECLLGNLIAGNNKYYFTANPDGIATAREKHSLEMLLFTLNDNGMAEYDGIPEPFANFLNAVDRKDLIKLADIKDDDGDYEKLYKLAGLRLKPAPFTIKRK